MSAHAELRILLLEDVPEEAEISMRELRRAGLEFVSRRVQTRADFAQSLEDFAPDLILADAKLPGFDGRSALQMLQSRKQVYRQNGVYYFRPWAFLITDGGPTDAWHNAARLVRSGEETKSLMFFAVGVEGANMEVLKQIAIREPMRLKGLRFRDLFSWLSNSLGSVSRSTPGEPVPLQNPATPDGWAFAG